jgi:DNA-binding MarR family transcriptional regulator
MAVMPASTSGNIDIPARCYCAHIRRAARNVTRFYDSCLVPFGITINQFTTLEHLKDNGPLQMNELAELLVMDRATLGHNLRPLLRDGLLSIEPDKKDRRARIVTITRAGLRRLEKVRPRWEQAQATFESAFGRSRAAEMRLMMDAAAEARLELPT